MAPWPRKLATSRLVREKIALICFLGGLLLGFLLAAFALREEGTIDWNVVLVAITATYVLLTYFLLRTGIRQAAASEQNIRLIRQQLIDEHQRKAGPIDILARQVQDLVRESKAALRDGMWGRATLFLPNHFDQMLALAATIDLYLHYELTSIQKTVSRLNDCLSRVRYPPDPDPPGRQAEVESAERHLKFLTSSLYNIRASINDWNEDGQ